MDRIHLPRAGYAVLRRGEPRRGIPGQVARRGWPAGVTLLVPLANRDRRLAEPAAAEGPGRPVHPPGHAGHASRRRHAAEGRRGHGSGGRLEPRARTSRSGRCFSAASGPGKSWPSTSSARTPAAPSSTRRNSIPRTNQKTGKFLCPCHVGQLRPVRQADATPSRPARGTWTSSPWTRTDSKRQRGLGPVPELPDRHRRNRFPSHEHDRPLNPTRPRAGRLLAG